MIRAKCHITYSKDNKDNLWPLVVSGDDDTSLLPFLFDIFMQDYV